MSSALLDSGVTTREYKRCAEEFLKIEGLNGEYRLRTDSETIYYHLLSPKLSRSSVRELYLLSENEGVARSLALEALKFLKGKLPQNDGWDKWESGVSSFKLPKKLYEWYTYRSLWEGVRDVMKDKQLLWSNTGGKKKKDTWHFRYGQPEILLCWLLDYQQVLMI